MGADENTPARDRPWRRPGTLRYAAARARGIIRPPVVVYEPRAGSVLVEQDLAVPVRDGTVLRLNLHRPPGAEPFPVIMSAHPYGKDRLPTLTGRRSRFSVQYRMLRQPTAVSFSTMTSWEAPDPAWWVEQGYAVINCDLRGAGTSEGVGTLMSDQEAEDVYDLIEWAGAQSWSDGNVGMLGVSYLGMSQFKAAALHPPSLKAICPWEAMTDIYRDLMRPGGLLEDGFSRVWTTGAKRAARLSIDMGAEQRRRPLRDDWWQSLVPDLGMIEVPILLCASFSDNNLHSRGSFRALQRVGSDDRFAYTHRGGKWATFYADPARQAQRAFFDRYLRGAVIDPPPRIRLEVREDRDTIAEVRDEAHWPLTNTIWRPLHLKAEGALSDTAPEHDGQITFNTNRRAATFTYTMPADTELTGPMAARLWISVDGSDDVDLVLGVEKWRGNHYVGFEGSYGFGRDRITTGWQKASLRQVDHQMSTPAEPVHTYLTPELLQPGEIVPVDIALGPSATLFRAGESLRLVVAGRWIWPRNPLTGQFPGHYRRAPKARCTLHWGAERPAYVLVPHIPRSAT